MSHLVMINSRGTAVRVNTGVTAVNYAKIQIEGTIIGYGESAFVVTSASASETENVQFLPSTSDKIYAYAFGRGLGRLTLGGMAFPQYCTPDSRGVTVAGVEQLFNVYEQSRFSKNFTPLRIFFSNMTFNGYLIGCSANYADASNSIAQWSLDFVTYRSPATSALTAVI